KADDVNGMAAAAQRVALRVRAQSRDQAGDLAAADRERHHQRRTARRQRLHLRRQTIVERVHTGPPFLVCLVLSLAAASRACTKTSDICPVTRSGSRRSRALMA